ncbi:uncharacterized protein [Centruroides vittatus]|uniref:uncharacterized protein n=1 Tax=Centruroides vittatus TaxID=120091 RepID=UPI0035105D03
MATTQLRKRLNINWTIGDDNLPTISVNNNPIRTNTCQRTLCSLLKKYHLRNLISKPNQGKAYGLTATSEVSNHFINNSHYTHFSDWYFIHRARLSIVALRGHKCFGNKTKRCRRCGFVRETLSHVLCHCSPNFRLITRRHNAILFCLIAAFQPKGATLLVNQRVPGFDENCRSDMVVIHKQSKSATIVDVTVPFKNGQAAFQAARDEKCRKYNSLVQHFCQRGYDTHISAFIVGGLGGYDHANEVTLQRLGINRNYSKLMRKLTISGDIYRQHLGYNQRRQFKNDDFAVFTRTSSLYLSLAGIRAHVTQSYTLCHSGWQSVPM